MQRTSRKSSEAEFRSTTGSDLARYDAPFLLGLYRDMLRTRALDTRIEALYKQGKLVAGCYSSRGQEAVSVGSAYALGPGDVVGPLIRNLGSMLVRGVAPREVFAQYMARGASPTGGRFKNCYVQG